MQDNDIAELFRGVYWHQKWEIAPGIVTPGVNDVVYLLDQAQVPADLSGKRILDIGAWNGCCSFECERRGATVLAIGPEDPQVSGFTRLANYLNSRVEYRFGTIYKLDPSELGTFDMVICFGVLYHLRYPLLGLDMVRRVCTDQMFLESACLEVDIRGLDKPYTLNELNPKLSEIPLLQFYRRGELNGDNSNWFSFNAEAVREMLKSSGFEPTHLVHIHDRIVARAKIVPGKPEWLTIGSGEGVHYDTLMRPIFGSLGDY